MAYGKIKPWFKKLWIEALTSGIVPQTQGQLMDSEGFCCLGVAQHIMCPMIIADSKGQPIYDPYVDSDCCVNDDIPTGDEGGIPADIREEMGLTAKAQERLVKLNDNKGYNFHEIANWIEKHL